MVNNNDFDWNEFISLGNEYIAENNSPAKHRTGISRFYYGAFCSSRDLINEKATYLGKKSKMIMTSHSADVHNETSRIFKHHKKYKKDNKGKIISKNLNKLRKMRNKADYDKTINQPLPDMIKKSKKISEVILNQLNELN